MNSYQQSTGVDIMVDLETLSSAPNACIVSIGATVFSSIGQFMAGVHNFYSVVDPKSSQRLGGSIDADTVKWWAQQSDGARAVFSSPDAVHLMHALGEFRRFCARFERPRIWGNGASFDNVVLRCAYEEVSRPVPWEWRDDRCYRTLKNLRPDIPFERSGEAHNALCDAIDQARHAERIFAAIHEGLADE
jgi:hypothetical protein